MANKTDTFKQLERQFSNTDLTLALERFDAAGLAYRADDPATLAELTDAAQWYGLMNRQEALLIDLAQYEQAKQ